MATRPPRIVDPHAVPVIGIDDHLPALPDSELTPSALRRSFAQTRDWTPEFNGDGVLITDVAATAASVLVPLVLREGALTVLLTRRTAHLRDHAGQISFPGGRAELHDESAVGTALREAQEEVGLTAEHVDVLGQLNSYTTVTSYVVTPVVALVRPEFELQLDRFEVEEAFEVPLQFLMTPAHHHRHALDFGGLRRQFLSIPWQGVDVQGQPRQYFIWGATAAMLRNLYWFLRR